MSGWEKFRKLDPALVRALFTALVMLASSFGYSIVNQDQQGAVWGIIAALLAIGQGFSTRDAVTPNAKVLAYVNNPDNPSTTHIFAGEATVSENRVQEVADAATTQGL